MLGSVALSSLCVKCVYRRHRLLAMDVLTALMPVKNVLSHL